MGWEIPYSRIFLHDCLAQILEAVGHPAISIPIRLLSPWSSFRNCRLFLLRVHYRVGYLSATRKGNEAHSCGRPSCYELTASRAGEPAFQVGCLGINSPFDELVISSILITGKRNETPILHPLRRFFPAGKRDGLTVLIRGEFPRPRPGTVAVAAENQKVAHVSCTFRLLRYQRNGKPTPAQTPHDNSCFR